MFPKLLHFNCDTLKEFQLLFPECRSYFLLSNIACMLVSRLHLKFNFKTHTVIREEIWACIL